MKMTLEKMKISNFKGIRELEIDFGRTTRISGMNGTGKTTIPDAFCWVLWNKDSRGNTPGTYDFHEKPLNEEGEEIHNIDTTVELDCRLDGQRFNLRRTQRENWVKKRGRAEAVFQGNASTYWINDVEVKLSDFRARIAQIASEDVFRLIGSLSAFNALDWKKRREQLIALSNVDVDEMLLQQERYRPLADECGQRGVAVDNLRKVLQDQRKRANDELRMLPVRIDEARRTLPEFKPNELQDAEYLIRDNTEGIERINGYIASARAQAGTVSHAEQILALESEALGVQRTIADAYHADKRKAERERLMASETYRRVAAELANIRARIERDKKELAEVEAARDALRAAYREEFEQKFTPPTTSGKCPTCGQALPEEMIQAAIDEARKAFDAARKERLLGIKQRGVEKSEAVKRIAEYIARNEAEAAELEKQLTAAEAERDAAYEQIKAMPAEPDYSSEPRIAELRSRIEELKAAQTESPDEKIAAYEQRKAELQAIIDRSRAILARRDAAIETQKRIAELECQQKLKADRVAELEQLIALAEQFVQGRCHALEDSINAKFPTVRWKLFEMQINGGINDVCQAYIPCGGSLVSYGSANTASQVNADIEIINVLSEHYELYLPLFVDNSERVNVIAPTKAQLISLAVSTDSELKIEKETV